MKTTRSAPSSDRLELLALFEMINSAYNLSVKLGLPNLSQPLSTAIVIASSSATIDEYLSNKNDPVKTTKH